MAIYCGTDIIEIERIKNAIEEYSKETKNVFLDKIFTLKEQEYCETKGKVKFQHYAARFAAKEAVFKALFSLLNNKYDISWKDIEIFNEDSGKPKVCLNNISEELQSKISNIDISLSHCKEYANAMAVVESK